MSIQKPKESCKISLNTTQQSNGGIDGESIEFVWNSSKDSHRLRFSDRSREI